MKSATARWVVAALILAVGCGSPRPERVVLGIALAASDHPAVQIAVEEINAEGGIDGVPLELEGLDWRFWTSTESNVLLDWADRLSSNEELLGLIGHSDSASTLAVAAIYNQREIPHIVTIATHPLISGIGPWTFRIGPSDKDQGLALAEFAVEDWGKQKIAVFYVNDDYGKALTRIFQERVEQLGGTIVSSVLHREILLEEDEVLIRSVLDRLEREDPPDLFFLVQRLFAATFTLREIRQRDFEAGILGADNLTHESILRTHPDLMRGVRAAQIHTPNLDNVRLRTFHEQFEAMTGFAPGYSEIYAYDAVYLFRQAVLNGGFSREGVKRYLESVIAQRSLVEGIGGRFGLNERHDARRGFRIVEIQPDGNRTLKTIEFD